MKSALTSDHMIIRLTGRLRKGELCVIPGMTVGQFIKHFPDVVLKTVGNTSACSIRNMRCCDMHGHGALLFVDGYLSKCSFVPDVMPSHLGGKAILNSQVRTNAGSCYYDLASRILEITGRDTSLHGPLRSIFWKGRTCCILSMTPDGFGVTLDIIA